MPLAWIEPIREFAVNMGLVFQIVDDLLDRFGTLEDIGKDVGQDDGKTTLVSLLGPDAARAEVCHRLEAAERALDPLGPAGQAPRRDGALPHGTGNRLRARRLRREAPVGHGERESSAKPHRAGAPIQDLCRACHAPRDHTVMAVDAEGRPLRVVCGFCGSQHNYRGGGGEDAGSRPSAAAPPEGAARSGATPPSPS